MNHVEVLSKKFSDLLGVSPEHEPGTIPEYLLPLPQIKGMEGVKNRKGKGKRREGSREGRERG